MHFLLSTYQIIHGVLFCWLLSPRSGVPKIITEHSYKAKDPSHYEHTLKSLEIQHLNNDHFPLRHFPLKGLKS